MNRTRIKIGNAARGSRELKLVLTFTGTTLTWSPKYPQAASWTVNIYDLSGKLLDNSGSIDPEHTSADITDLWNPPPFQIAFQAVDIGGSKLGPESNKITWAG